MFINSVCSYFVVMFILLNANASSSQVNGSNSRSHTTGTAVKHNITLYGIQLYTP